MTATTQHDATDEVAPAPLTHRQILIVFSGLMLGMLLAMLDSTIVATALPTIVGDLGGLGHLSWVITAYLLTTTTATPLYGKLSDLYGRKPLFQTAIGIFVVGSALSGLAHSMTQLIAFRAIQGVGAGGLMAMAMAIIGDIVSPRERGRYQGYTGGVVAFASVAGPLVGGYFVDNLSWRWAFYVNVPVGIIALVVTSLVLKLPRHRREHRIDFLGSGVLVAGLTVALFVSVWGGSQYPWFSAQIAALFALAVALFVLFVVVEQRAPEAVLPLRLFRNRVFSVSSLAGFIVGFAMYGAIFFVPLYLQIVNGASPTKSGLELTPLMLGVVVASVGSGQLITRMGRYKVFPVLGTAVMTVGLYLLSRLAVDTPRLTSSLYMAVVGLGIGLVMQVLVLATQNAVEFRDLGTATSAVSLFRSMGGAFGVAAFGSILSTRLAANLARVLPAGAGAKLDATALSSGPAALKGLTPALRADVLGAFANALHVVFLWSVPVGALSFVTVLFLREIRLRDTIHVGQAVGEEAGIPFGTGELPEAAPVLVDAHA